MAYPTAITSAHYSKLLMFTGSVPAQPWTTTNLSTPFVTATNVTEITNIRDMPALGTPANIVKVPVYGQAQSQSVGAQSDAPDLEIVINYVPSIWQAGSAPANLVADGVSKVFMFSFLTAKPTSTLYTVGGLGTAPNANFFFVGRLESMLVQPARDDAATATLALSIQSDFLGPTTI
jgi:hypothetical protein